MEGVNSIVIYLIYHKNFCKCLNIPPPSITIKKVKNKIKDPLLIKNLMIIMPSTLTFVLSSMGYIMEMVHICVLLRCENLDSLQVLMLHS
jgi:hypothetical protein